MKKVGNLKEIRGTSAIDFLAAKDKQIAFGLSSDDKLKAVSDPLLGIKNGSVLVGGFGNDTYRASKKGVTVVLDYGDSSEINRLIAKGIGINSETSFAAEIDNRHLFAGDTKSEQYVLIIDWKTPRNRIERVSLADGDYKYDDIRANYKGLAGYLGNFSWKRAARELLDLGRLGLSPSTVNGAIRNAMSRANELAPVSSSGTLKASNTLAPQMPWEGVSPIASQSAPFQM